ncbi:FHA domain-containing protein [Acidipropionibacterium thoenii]|uniref:FHA domain-containing protein n=1 Tax=Acidipropionibacterium thoenii TaxID=1751 RepID=UPI0004805C8B|nr:FHA domain-containing protein [Acidipropionibacterium thoenii]
MSQSFGSWRASYTPGNWVVLAGASSLVVMQPAVPRHAELIARIWKQVAQAEDAGSLVQTLAAIGLSQMPSLGVFFWTGEQMTSLARGGVVVKEAATGRVVNHGDGVITWREVGLDPSIVTVEMEQAPESLVMPLLLGVVQASRLTIDATGTVEPLVVDGQVAGLAGAGHATGQPDADALSPSTTPGSSESSAPSGSSAPAGPVAVPAPHAALVPPVLASPSAPPATQESGDVFADVDDLGLAPAVSASSPEEGAEPAPSPDQVGDGLASAAAGQAGSSDSDDIWGPSAWSSPESEDPWAGPERVAPEGPDQAGGEASDQSSAPSGWGDPETSMAHDGATMFMPGLGSQVPESGEAPADPQMVGRPCLGVLAASTGESIDLAGPVLVGRAPNGGATDPQASLLRVVSPHQDISRTHVRVAPNGRSIEVTDMNSTNGTLVRHPGEEAIRLSPGETVTVEIGAVIDLGDGVSLEIAPPRS